MLIYLEKQTISGTDSTWLSGTISKNTSNRMHGILQQVHIESTTSTTTYKFKIISPDNLTIWDSNDYAENILRRTNLNLPLKGIYTMSIYSSSEEENFTILLGMQED